MFASSLVFTPKDYLALPLYQRQLSHTFLNPQCQTNLIYSVYKEISNVSDYQYGSAFSDIITAH